MSGAGARELAARIVRADAAFLAARAMRYEGATVERFGDACVVRAGGSPLTKARGFELVAQAPPRDVPVVVNAALATPPPGGHLLDVLVRAPEPHALEPQAPALGGVELDAGEAWAECVTRGFSGEPGAPEGSPARDEMLRLARSLRGLDGTACALLRCDGEPAAAAALHVRDGLALLTSASTRAPFRRRGLHARLVLARLELARREGCDLAVAWASPGSVSHASLLRLGFRIACSEHRIDPHPAW